VRGKEGLRTSVNRQEMEDTAQQFKQRGGEVANRNQNISMIDMGGDGQRERPEVEGIKRFELCLRAVSRGGAEIKRYGLVHSAMRSDDEKEICGGERNRGDHSTEQDSPLPGKTRE